MAGKLALMVVALITLGFAVSACDSSGDEAVRLRAELDRVRSELEECQREKSECDDDKKKCDDDLDDCESKDTAE